ncbi:MAG: hypothetical protein PHX93_01685 [Candidatus Peribacteraceae bacterium]|jgi:hypothetical protein|nr:hypothetical protein [Candidatus Peribacteraceae bacterium]
MSTIEHSDQSDSATINPLEACGGFEAYQSLLREAVIANANGLTMKQVKEFDASLFPGDRVDGLEQGLAGIALGTCKKPITSENIELLEMTLNIARTALLRPKLEPYLTTGKPGDPMGLVIDKSGQGLDRRTAEFILKIADISRASDAEITLRQQEARRAMEIAEVIDSAG